MRRSDRSEFRRFLLEPYTPPKRRRVRFSAWGRGVSDLEMPAYAVTDEPGPGAEAVYAAIGRANHLTLCAGPCPQGTRLEHGRAAGHHYSGTLGRPCRGGGWTPVVEVWIEIEVSP